MISSYKHYGLIRLKDQLLTAARCTLSPILWRHVSNYSLFEHVFFKINWTQFRLFHWENHFQTFQWIIHFLIVKISACLSSNGHNCTTSYLKQFNDYIVASSVHSLFSFVRLPIYLLLPIQYYLYAYTLLICLFYPFPLSIKYIFFHRLIFYLSI